MTKFFTCALIALALAQSASSSPLIPSKENANTSIGYSTITESSAVSGTIKTAMTNVLVVTIDTNTPALEYCRFAVLRALLYRFEDENLKTTPLHLSVGDAQMEYKIAKALQQTGATHYAVLNIRLASYRVGKFAKSAAPEDAVVGFEYTADIFDAETKEAVWSYTARVHEKPKLAGNMVGKKLMQRMKLDGIVASSAP